MTTKLLNLFQQPGHDEKELELIGRLNQLGILPQAHDFEVVDVRLWELRHGLRLVNEFLYREIGSCQPVISCLQDPRHHHSLHSTRIDPQNWIRYCRQQCEEDSYFACLISKLFRFLAIKIPAWYLAEHFYKIWTDIVQYPCFAALVNLHILLSRYGSNDKAACAPQLFGGAGKAAQWGAIWHCTVV